MKISFYLTNNRNMRDGVTRYASEIIKRVNLYDNVDCEGEAFISYKDDKQEVLSYFSKSVPKLPVKIVKTFLPMRWLHRFCEYKIPFSYNSLMHSNSDIYVFFHNFLPRCKLKGKKIVVIHDLTPLYDNKISEKKKKRIFNHYKYTVDTADLIFTDSEYSKKEIVKYFKNSESKIIVNYCGIDYEKYSIKTCDYNYVREKYKLTEKFILFMGQARANKNLENLIKAYNALPNNIKDKYSLVLANHTPNLISLINELNLNNNIILLNGIDENDIVSVYKSAELVTLVSTSEGFGLPLVEAMAAGTATITSNCSCLPEIVDDASLLVNPYDYLDISKGILKVLIDQELRETLIEKGLNQAKKYSWSNTADNFLKGINKLLESNES